MVHFTTSRPVIGMGVWPPDRCRTGSDPCQWADGGGNVVGAPLSAGTASSLITQPQGEPDLDAENSIYKFQKNLDTKKRG